MYGAYRCRFKELFKGLKKAEEEQKTESTKDVFFCIGRGES